MGKKNSTHIDSMELDQLLKDPRCEFNQKWSNYFETDVYVLDEKVIIPQTRTIWEKRELEESIREVEYKIGAPPRHILADLFHFGKEFAELAPSISSQLSVMLKANPCDLDFSVESLKRIDEMLEKQNDNLEKMKKEGLFDSLLAYLGEMIIARSKGCRWEIRQSEGISEPWLVTDDGTECPVFRKVYMCVFYNRNRKPSLYRAFNSIIFSKFSNLPGPSYGYFYCAGCPKRS